MVTSTPADQPRSVADAVTGEPHGRRGAPHRPTAAAAVALVLALLALALAAPAQAAAASTPQQALAVIKARHDAVRAAAGLQPLVENSVMDAVAQGWAQRMADRSDTVGSTALVHSPADANYDYSTHIPAGYRQAAENIAYNTSRDPDSMVDAWLASTPHRNTIYTGVYGYVGYGVAFNRAGHMYSAVEFAQYTSTPAGTNVRPGATASPSATASATASPSATRTATASPSASATVSPSATASRTPTASPSVTPSATVSPSATPSASAPPSSSTSSTRTDRYAAAVVAARAAYPHPTLVVLASGSRDDAAQAKAAAAFAKSLGAPLLLTYRRDLPEPVAAYLGGTPGITAAIVVGSRSSVSDAILADLRAHHVNAARVGRR